MNCWSHECSPQATALVMWMSLILPPSPAEDNGNLTVMGRDEGSSLPPWHCVGSKRDLPLLPHCVLLDWEALGALEIQHFLTNSPGSTQTNSLLVLSQNPTVKLYRNSRDIFPKETGKCRDQIFLPGSSWAKLMGSQTLSTTKSFGAARQVFSVCPLPAIPRGNTDTPWKICHGNAPGETLPHCPAHDINPNGTTVTFVTHQPLNNQTVLPAWPGPGSSPSCSRIPHWAQDQGTQTPHYCK